MFLKAFRKQSFLAVALSVCLMMNFTYTAFASDDFPQGFVPPSWVDNGETYIGIFDLTDFSSEEKEMFYNHVKSPYSLYWLSYVSDQNYNQFIRFYLLDNETVISGYPNAPNDFGFLKNGVSVSCPYFEFMISGFEANKPQSSRKWTPQSSGNAYLFSGGPFSLSFKLFPRATAPNGLFFTASSLIGGDFLNGGSIVDSAKRFIEINPLGDIHFLYIPVEQPPDPPPTPTPKPTLPPVDPPKPPDVTQPPIDYPTFPKIESIYVPYDTSVWNEFSHRVRSSVGSATNVGFTLLSIIMGILVVLGIVRKFSGAGKGVD